MSSVGQPSFSITVMCPVEKIRFFSTCPRMVSGENSEPRGCGMAGSVGFARRGGQAPLKALHGIVAGCASAAKRLYRVVALRRRARLVRPERHRAGAGCAGHEDEQKRLGPHA